MVISLKKVFTEEEVKYILDNWGKESAHSMKKKFNCSWYAVCNVAKEHGLELPKSNEWTKEEIEFLKELSKTHNYKDIAKIMNKTETAIYLKAKKLGITIIQDRRGWTKEEEEQLKDLWGSKSIEYIAKTMKRSIFSIKVKAVRMNLGSMISNNYDSITVSDISELFGVTRDRVTITWASLGLKLNDKKVTKNRSYYVVKWEDLMEFLENNQNEWDSRNLDINILGPEPSWLKEKRKRDLCENPLWYRRWTNEEVKEVENLFNMGKDYKEIASILNRSENSVADILRKLGYSYRLPQYWKGREIKYLRENYQNMTYKEIAEVLGRTPKAVATKASELGFQKKIKNKGE